MKVKNMKEIKTIDTAPKDGTTIMLFSEGNWLSPCYFDKETCEYHLWSWFRVVDMDCSEVKYATHWCPIPETPKVVVMKVSELKNCGSGKGAFYGLGHGCGSGWRCGSAYGAGGGCGFHYENSYGYGAADGSGHIYGHGDGAGDGHGYGSGDGDGDGFGHGVGAGRFN